MGEIETKEWIESTHSKSQDFPLNTASKKQAPLFHSGLKKKKATDWHTAFLGMVKAVSQLIQLQVLYLGKYSFHPDRK